jgi:hypothetical protein
MTDVFLLPFPDTTDIQHTPTSPTLNSHPRIALSLLSPLSTCSDTYYREEKPFFFALAGRHTTSVLFSGREPPTRVETRQLSIPTAKVLIWSLRMGAFLREGGTYSWAAAVCATRRLGVLGGPQGPVCRCTGTWDCSIGISWCLVMYGVIVCEWLPLLFLPHSALE